MDFEAIIANLTNQINDLRLENTNFRIELACLRQEDIALRQENILLRLENDRLKERLGLNSTNSSLPPSRDIYKVKRTTRVKSGRKPGGQPGHPFHGYKKRQADEIVDVFAQTCTCGQALDPLDSFQIHQKIDIPPIKPFVTEYHLHHGYCVKCRKRTTPCLPQGVKADLLGDNAKAVITSLSGFFHQSKRQLQHMLGSIFNLPLSLGLISMTEKRVSQKVAPYYQGLIPVLEESPYIHIDETGHKSKGKRGWGWIFTNKDTSVLKLTSSRGMKVLQSVLPSYDGWVISDRYSSYRYFDADKRQVCLSHIKRDFERFSHSRNAVLSGLGQRLGLILGQVFAYHKAFRKGRISKLLYQRKIVKFKKQMYYTLKGILDIPDAIHAYRVAQNLLKCFEMMWRFVDHPEIEPTNNLAERQIRKYVIYRKTSLFTWSQRGNEYIERMMSLFLTARLQKQSPFPQLSNLIAQ